MNAKRGHEEPPPASRHGVDRLYPARPEKARRYTAEHDKSTGMALTLAALLLWLVFRRDACVFTAMCFLVCAMTAPVILRPVTVLWFGFAEAAGWVSSRVILCAVYVLLVFPVGFARKLAGRDELRLREFKKGRGSVFNAPERTVEAEDIRNPY